MEKLDLEDALEDTPQVNLYLYSLLLSLTGT